MDSDEANLPFRPATVREMAQSLLNGRNGYAGRTISKNWSAQFAKERERLAIKFRRMFPM